MNKSNTIQNAISAYNAQDFLKLEQVALQMLDSKDNTTFAYKCLSVAYNGLHKYDLALQNMKKLTIADPSDYENFLNMGKLLYKLSCFNEAIKALETAHLIAPKNIFILNELAKSMAKVGRFQDAIQYFALSIKLDPNNPEAYILASDIFTLIGRVRDSMEILHIANKRFSNVAEVHHRLGITMQRAKNLPSAIKNYKKAVSLLLKRAISSKQGPPANHFNYLLNGDTLLKTLALLAKHEIKAFAASGSLLGLIREGHLLPNDKDVDMGVFSWQMEDAVRCLQSNGWSEYCDSYGLESPRVFQHKETGLLLDLYKYEVDGDRIISGFFIQDIPNEWNRVVEYSHFEVVKRESKYGEIWQIANPEKYLRELYGDWQMPDPDFESIIFANNLRSFSLLTQCYALNKIFNYLQDGKLGKIKKIATVCHKNLPNDEIYISILSNPYFK